MSPEISALVVPVAAQQFPSECSEGSRDDPAAGVHGPARLQGRAPVQLQRRQAGGCAGRANPWDLTVADRDRIAEFKEVAELMPGRSGRPVRPGGCLPRGGAGRERDPRVRGDDPAQAGLLGGPSWARPGPRASRTARGRPGGIPEGAGGGNADGRPPDEEGDGGLPPAPGRQLTDGRGPAPQLARSGPLTTPLGPGQCSTRPLLGWQCTGTRSSRARPARRRSGSARNRGEHVP